MQSGELNEIDVMVRKYITPGLHDLYFKKGPFIKRLQANEESFPGGDTIQVDFRYAPMKTSFFTPGATFDITRRQTKQGMSFTTAWVYANVTEYLEDLEVLLANPDAGFGHLEDDMQNAAQSLSTKLEIAAFGDGTGDDSQAISGLANIANDGSTSGWTGSAFSTYGTLSRSNANYGSLLQGGMKNVNGPLTYNILVEEFAKMSDGDEEPDLIVTTKLCYAYLKEKFQAQQIFTSKEDPLIPGFRGFEFESATVLKSHYCPGSLGTNNADLGNYLYSGYETLWILTTKHIKLYVASSDMFHFGWSGFKPAQDSNKVAGQLQAALNIVCEEPDKQKQLFGITG